MIKPSVIRISTRLFILVLLSLCLWFFAGTRVSTQKTENKRSLPVEARQLDPVGGVLQVELRCADAKLSGTGTIDEASCVVKNNRFAAMVAGTLKVSITLEQAGTLNVISGYETFDTFLHPDFREDHKSNLIQPGMVYRFDLMPADYGNAIITKIEAEVDYVEFADEAALGPNHAGARIISNIRQGAAKYRNWLVARYEASGKSANSILEVLDRDPAISADDIGLQNSDQKSGANMYRNFARRTYRTLGSEALVRHFKRQ